jgi:hypothetical protein
MMCPQVPGAIVLASYRGSSKVYPGKIVTPGTAHAPLDPDDEGLTASGAAEEDEVSSPESEDVAIVLYDDG